MSPAGPGFADDQAMMAAACLTLYETTWDLRWFVEARSLADDLIRLFFDDERGGFFQTGSDAETLVVRPKELYDNAVPSGNSVAAEVLLRLAMLTGEPEYERLAASALRLVRDAMGEAPTGFGHALSALDLYLGPGREVAIAGDPDDERTRALAAEVGGAYRPNAVLAVGVPGGEGSATVPLLADRVMRDGVPTAYVCRRFTCNLPVTDVIALREQLVGARLDAMTTLSPGRSGAAVLAPRSDRARRCRCRTSPDARSSSTSIRRPTRPGARPSRARCGTHART